MAMQIKYVLGTLVRALRFPFLTASILPFIFGSLAGRSPFNYLLFMFGILTVAATHLSSNLINDYFDSKSKADWQDRRFYGFFGGSKLIQEGVISERQYFIASVLCAIVAFICAVVISLYLNNLFPLFAYLAVIFLGWQYTGLPLKFSYRALGELVIFLLFGPVLVMGAYFIQTGVFADIKSLVISLPFGFFTLAILISNEIADYLNDKNVQKYTWVVWTGGKLAYFIYFIVIILGFFSIIFCVYSNYLNNFALLVLFLIPDSIKAGAILKKNYADKVRLCESSKIVIWLQTKVSLILIMSALINRLELF